MNAEHLLTKHIGEADPPSRGNFGLNVSTVEHEATIWGTVDPRSGPRGLAHLTLEILVADLPPVGLPAGLLVEDGWVDRHT